MRRWAVATARCTASAAAGDSSAGAIVHSVPSRVSPEANFKTLYDNLAAAQAGAASDAMYRQQMIATHPTVEHHLEMANALPQAQ